MVVTLRSSLPRTLLPSWRILCSEGEYVSLVCGGPGQEGNTA